MEKIKKIIIMSPSLKKETQKAMKMLHTVSFNEYTRQALVEKNERTLSTVKVGK